MAATRTYFALLRTGIDELKVISPTLLILLTIVLQTATVIVLVMFLIGDI
ncbi:MAG: hypothetical protein M9941_18895 [Anaerolineae bacterium]|nr:hypothetical protein [Anaerolineae bacterium]